MQIYAEKKSEQNNLLLRTPRNRRRAVELGQHIGKLIRIVSLVIQNLLKINDDPEYS